MTTAVSAPGKVLLAGGYLVLDRGYTGLVFGLTARIHVIIKDISTSAGVELSEIRVKSPQFQDAQWNYGYSLLDKDRGVEVTQLRGASLSSLSRNTFVETALTYALTYISSVTDSKFIKPVDITILADNDYYSQAPATTTSKLDQNFSDFGVRLQDAHKTGLGSSAALVTSFTAALLSHYLPDFSITTPSGQTKLHNLAQAAHCAAQGKVGSGFDVAAAVYGTCLYRRFSPDILTAVGEANAPKFSLRLHDTIEGTKSQYHPSPWDTEIKKDELEIPKGLALIMCDVDCGSQTVGMVKKLLEWRKQNSETANEIWGNLQRAQEELAVRLTAARNSEVGSGSIDDLAKSFKELRKNLQPMTQQSGVPVEPAEQTKLLDTLTDKVEGVIGGVVPGAGGYDAIALLVKDNEQTMDEIKGVLKVWNQENKDGNVKILGVKGEMEGARKENGAAKIYGNWIGWD